MCVFYSVKCSLGDNYCTVIAFRTKMLISLVWVISFIICFPPLIGWGADPGQSSHESRPLNLR